MDFYIIPWQSVVIKPTRFVWDAAKDEENRKKHGIPFSLAQYAFADPRRIAAEDLAHSETEKRYFCFGEVEGGILTVRFTYGLVRLLM